MKKNNFKVLLVWVFILMSQKFLLRVGFINAGLVVVSDGDCVSVGVTQNFNSWSCPNSWGIICLLGPGKNIGGNIYWNI